MSGLKVHGLKLGALHRCQFAAKVEAMLADAPDLRIATEPLPETRNMMRTCGDVCMIEHHSGTQSLG